MDKQVNERVRELRKALDLTLEKFGERLGVSKVAISLIENGKNAVTDQMFKSICREFNVNKDWLCNGVGNMFLSLEEENASVVGKLLRNQDDAFLCAVMKILRAYDHLSPDGKKVLQELIENAFENRESQKD